MIVFGAFIVGLGLGGIFGVYGGIWIQMENERERVERLKRLHRENQL